MSNDATETPKKKEPNSRQAALIECLKNETIETFLDQCGTSFIVVGNSTRKKVFAIKSRDFRSYLAALSYKTFRMPLKKDQQDEIILMLDCEIRHGECPRHRDLFLRVAKDGEGNFWYDLGDAGGVRISNQGWSVVNNCPPLFRPSELLLNQVSPIEGGSIHGLISLFNLKHEQDKINLAVYLTCALIPEINIPMLLIFGSKGSSKTTSSKMIAKVIDPNTTDDFNFRKVDDAMDIAAKIRLILADNVSSISADVSDFLCKLVTGSSHQKRELYSNDEISTKKLKNVVIINGIPVVLTKPDALDRTLLLELKPIDHSKRIDDASLKAKFDETLPSALGSMFDAIAKARIIYSSIKIEKPIRMMDFHYWAIAVGIGLGFTQEQVDNALQANYKRQIDQVVECSPFLELIEKYLTDALVFEGTPTELQGELKRFSESNGMDVQRILRINPNALTRELQRLEELMVLRKITFERLPRGANRVIRLEMESKEREIRRKYNDGNDGNVAGTSFENFVDARVTQPKWEKDFYVDTVDGDDEMPSINL